MHLYLILVEKSILVYMVMINVAFDVDSKQNYIFFILFETIEYILILNRNNILIYLLNNFIFYFEQYCAILLVNQKNLSSNTEREVFLVILWRVMRNYILLLCFLKLLIPLDIHLLYVHIHVLQK